VIWLNPLALIGLVAVAAPILIHILVQRRAERFPFPTLRFIQPTRLAAIRRHVLEDAALLAVRAALVAAAVAALAGPLVVTGARRRAWDRRVVQAVVTDAGGAELAPPSPVPPSGADQGRPLRPAPQQPLRPAPQQPPRPALQQIFETASLPDGMRRAAAWLDAAPPARREMVVVSPFALGSMTAADVAAVPASVGIRFERRGALPGTRTVAAGRVLTSASAVVAREATLSGARTTVRESATTDRVPWPVDVRAPSTARPAMDAAVAAVLSQRVWAPPSDHRARLVVLEPASLPGVVQALRPAIDDVEPIRQPWMADAVARIARDGELQTAASRVAAGLADARLAGAPWHALAFAADGRALAAAAGSPAQLVVVSAANAEDIVTPLLMRSIVNGLAVVPDLQNAEVVPIPDRLLREWSRPAPAPDVPRIDTIDQDDRRWLWLAVLCLLAIETWMRRTRSSAAAAEDGEEDARVA
jgi:hypothetical protein